MTRTTFSLPFGRSFCDLGDLRLVRAKPRRGFEQLGLLYAEAGASGELELLNSAWQDILGYEIEDLDGRSLRGLIAADERSTRAIFTSLFNDQLPEPLEFALRCNDGSRRHFRWHRQFDGYSRVVFIAGEELIG